MTVVGVVGNVHQFTLDEKPTLDTYVPYRQVPTHSFTLVVRRAANPLGLAAQLRQEVLALDRQQPISRLGLLSEMVDRSLAARRFQMLLIGSLALLALVLASLGGYGVMSYAVLQRTQEVGVRMALGARRGQVFALVLRGTLAMTGAGIAAGVLGSLALGRFLQALLYGIRSNDPAVFALCCSPCRFSPPTSQRSGPPRSTRPSPCARSRILSAKTAPLKPSGRRGGGPEGDSPQALQSTIQPSSRRTMRLPYSAFFSEWVTWTMVVPSSLSRLNSFMISSAWEEWRLPVGSSASSSFGLPITARATPTSCCWPPESCEGKRSFLPTMWKRSSASATRAWRP